jgi:hypothetical protein
MRSSRLDHYRPFRALQAFIELHSTVAADATLWQAGRAGGGFGEGGQGLLNRQGAKTPSLNFTTEVAEKRGGRGDKKTILRAFSVFLESLRLGGSLPARPWAPSGIQVTLVRAISGR